MAKNTIHTAGDTGNSKKLDSFAILAPSLLPRPRNSHSFETQSTDELIRSLSESYENRRAKQVSEWVRSQSNRAAR